MKITGQKLKGARMMQIIDSHIHLDLYEKAEQKTILQELKAHHVQALISVSKDLESAKQNLSLRKLDSRIKVAIGFHPEQPLPSKEQIEKIFKLVEENKEEIVAIGEVGLPYYLRRKDPSIPNEPYIELLESFILLAKRIDKPIVLHAIYEDATLVCNLLEKYKVGRAHFHWFKGDQSTLNFIIDHGHVISITPDVCYEEEIQRIVNYTPLEHILVETDGPWPFKEQFARKRTHPKMIHQSIQKIAQIKQFSLETTYRQIYENTKKFFNL